MVLEINLARWSDLRSTICDFDGLRELAPNEPLTIIIHHACGSFVPPDSYLIIVAVYHEYSAKGHAVNVVYDTSQHCDTVDYASRIDFFRNVGVAYDEGFARGEPEGLVEITNISPEAFTPPDALIEAFRDRFQLTDDALDAFVTAVDELTCNVRLHASSNAGGFIFSQIFPKRGTVEFIIVDAGIGIQESMTRKYEGINNETALRNCIDYEVTGGNGRGHGLYIVTELARRNGGNAIIVSGDNCLRVNATGVNVTPHPFWQGTIAKFTFHLDNNLSVGQILSQINYSRND